MTYVALLRAINVASRSVPMADLRALCEDLGWRQVRTYIQSGNVVFEADADESALASALKAAMAAQYPFPVPVMVRSADRWRELAADRPFGGWTHPKQLSVSLLSSAPEAAAWAALSPWKEGDDEIELIGDRVWIKTPGGYGVNPFNNAFLEKKLKRDATTRNRATVDALLGMLGSP